jgi:predicted RNA-binding Zn ribbon-like protein
MSDSMQSEAHDKFIFLADHPALDILNTVSLIDGKLVDSLQSDADVSLWLARVGWPVDEHVADLPSSSLLNAMRALREAIRTLVERRKAGALADVGALNAFLAAACSRLELLPGNGGGLQVQRRWRLGTAEEMLAPLAEAAADLLTTVDLSLVRRCESDDCVLWFYDRTKSHHRRWCSMATCGNRHKVAAFRQRRQRGES